MNSRILFTGDCRIDGQFRQGVCDLFRFFPGYDLYVINFESSIHMNESTPLAKKSVPITASKEELKFLLTCVEPHRLLLNFANNHSGDAGVENLEEAKAWLRSKGVYVIDSGESVEIQVQESTYSFHAFGQVDWRHSAPKLSRNSGTHNIALLHWGEEYVFSPHPEQRLVAQTLAECGVDYIIGAHPHVLQGWERIESCSVFYSLGNTVFGFSGMPCEAELGSVLSLRGGSSDPGAELIPVLICKDGHLKHRGASAENGFERLIENLNNGLHVSEWKWNQIAAEPFFKNHLKSWGKRIAMSGFPEVVRFLRACCSGTYRSMFLGILLAPVSRKMRASTMRDLQIVDDELRRDA